MTQTIDKSLWGAGPWQDEPDRVDWTHAGLPCLMVRHPELGTWCGYAAVPPGHPLHGRTRDQVDLAGHRGVNYAAPCTGVVCHVPQPGEPDNVWWFGFDCAHGGDFVPAVGPALRLAGRPDLADAIELGEVYRTLDYVQARTNDLAEQLARIPPDPTWWVD